MKKVIITCFLLVNIYTLFAQNDTCAETAIKTIIQKQEDAWNKHEIIGKGAAYFTDAVDTYSKVVSAYDNIVHALKDSTEIDLIITDLPKLK